MIDTSFEPGPSALPRSERPSGPWQVVQLRGELDLSSAPQFERAVEEALDTGAVVIAVDVSDVHFADSSGLRALLRASEAVSARGGSLLLDGLSPAIERLLEITGLLEHLRDGEPRAVEAPDR